MIICYFINSRSRRRAQARQLVAQILGNGPHSASRHSSETSSQDSAILPQADSERSSSSPFDSGDSRGEAHVDSHFAVEERFYPTYRPEASHTREEMKQLAAQKGVEEKKSASFPHEGSDPFPVEESKFFTPMGSTKEKEGQPLTYPVHPIAEHPTSSLLRDIDPEVKVFIEKTVATAIQESELIKEMFKRLGTLESKFDRVEQILIDK
ncbi:hypothetical protein FGO68_gene4226 [Halteria grandinella]|uniref:Uncharacterized protein n=1 Tax=Halteria grandinella TaxID=5974 RepID=A0A8J8NJY9_HALGN|nr:hypothetical protein FGO68_gene4226 [Halteria grandinella]